MTHDGGDMAALRLALAMAERARDDALVEAAVLRQRWQDERREEQYRVRDMVSVIRDIARRTGDDVDSVEEYCGVLDGRLSAYLNVRSAVTQDRHEGADLALLIAGALQAFGLKEGERLDLAGPPVRLTGLAAGILALAFHELALRAAMSDRVGESGSRVAVNWRLSSRQPTRALAIRWCEPASGHGQRDEAPSSWADWVEQAIACQIAGTLVTTVDDAGRSTRICLPVAAMC